MGNYDNIHYGSRYCFECRYWMNHNRNAVGTCDNKLSDYCGISTGALHQCNAMSDDYMAPTHKIVVKYRGGKENIIHQVGEIDAWLVAKQIAMDLIDNACEEQASGVCVLIEHGDDGNQILLLDDGITFARITVFPIEEHSNAYRSTVEKARETRNTVIKNLLRQFLNREIKELDSEDYSLSIDYAGLASILDDMGIHSNMDLEVNGYQKDYEETYHIEDMNGKQIRVTGSMMCGTFQIFWDK